MSRATAAPRAGRPVGWTVDGVAVGRTVSGRQLRAATAATVVLAAAVAVAGDAGSRLAPLPVLAGLLVAAGTALAPTTPAPTLGLLLVVAVVVDVSPPLWVVVLLAAMLHGVHLMAAWCAAVPPSARMPVAALTPTMRRWAVTQVLVLPVALGVGLTRADGGRSAGAALAGGVVLLLLSLLVLRTVRRVVGRTTLGGPV